MPNDLHPVERNLQEVAKACDEEGAGEGSGVTQPQHFLEVHSHCSQLYRDASNCYFSWW